MTGARSDGRILVLEPGEDGAVRDVRAPDIVHAGSLEGALDHLRSARAEGDRFALGAIGTSVERPLTAGRELRRIDGSIGLVFAVGRDARATLSTRLGLVPELAGTTLLDADTPLEELEASLRSAAGAAARKREVRGAMDEMNRRLLEMRAGGGTQEPQTRVAESYLAALTRYVPDAIIALDRDHRVASMNEAALHILGLGDESPEGMDLIARFASRPEGELERLVSAAGDGKPQERNEVRLVRPDGRTVLLSLTAAPIGPARGEVAGVVVIARDITVEKRAVERLRELQKARSLATLAGGVAHDFNNLLVSVQGWADLAREDLDDEEVLETALTNISTSAERAADLARAMLAYGGRGEFELQPTDLTRLVRELSSLLRATVDRSVELVFELADGLREVAADQTQIRQVLLNLVTNACEAIGEGGGTVTVRTYAREVGHDQPDPTYATPAGRYVVLEVADDGPGMDEETRDRVFDPFFTTKFAGRGLGLAASQGIARAHGGALVAASEPGQGASFSLLLPPRQEGAS